MILLGVKTRAVDNKQRRASFRPALPIPEGYRDGKKRWKKNQPRRRSGGLKRATGRTDLFKIEDRSRIGAVAGGS
jgi:hypothetical protein